jgi:hypothetical protein
MKLDDLIAEGESLIRPCFLLTQSPRARLGGYWGGERRDRPNALPPEATALTSLRHIITINEDLLAELGLPSAAPLSLFEASTSAEMKVIAWSANRRHDSRRSPAPVSRYMQSPRNPFRQLRLSVSMEEQEFENGCATLVLPVINIPTYFVHPSQGSIWTSSPGAHLSIRARRMPSLAAGI